MNPLEGNYLQVYARHNLEGYPSSAVNAYLSTGILGISEYWAITGSVLGPTLPNPNNDIVFSFFRHYYPDFDDEPTFNIVTQRITKTLLTTTYLIA